MNAATLSWRPRWWQSSHLSLLDSAPTWTYWYTNSFWLFDGSQEEKGAASFTVHCWSCAICLWIPKALTQFLTLSVLQNNRRSPGRDINVTGVWERNVTGRGVTVVVVDDGVEHTIQDIAPNYVSGPGDPPTPISHLLRITSSSSPFLEV